MVYHTWSGSARLKDLGLGKGNHKGQFQGIWIYDFHQIINIGKSD